MAFDEHYEPYLYSLGVPAFAVPLILRSSETIIFTATEKGATMVTETGETVSQSHHSELKNIFVSSLENSRSDLRVEPCVEHDIRQEQWSHVEQLHEGETERHLLQVINVSQIFCKLYLLSFSSEEREKGWFLTSRMTFSELGMINERHFINHDICK